MAEQRWLGGIGPLFVLGFLAGCGSDVGVGQDGDLPSWAPGTARDSIFAYVHRVTDAGGSDFVAPADRIAVFDNDGTLIVERPTPIQFAFMNDRVRTLAPDNPDWSSTQPFQAVIENDRERMRKMTFEERRLLGIVTQGNLTEDEYRSLTTEFLATSRHPRFPRRRVDSVYLPMLELVKFLQANEFRIFIVTGGGMEFVRSYSEEIYSVPRENVIGSSRKTKLRELDDHLEIYRVSKLNSINARQFKPLNIYLHTGRRPILAVGNSDGDLEMLRFTDEGSRSSLVLLLYHDDPEREIAYTDGAVDVQRMAEARGWQAVSMRRDFKKVFIESPAP